MKILRNMIRCTHCGTLIESHHRHDFATHSCDGLKAYYGPQDSWIAADGGTAYLRRVGNRQDWEEASTYEDTNVNG